MCVNGFPTAFWIFGHSLVCCLQYSAQLRLETDWSNSFHVAIKVAFRTDSFSPPSTAFECTDSSSCNGGTCNGNKQCECAASTMPEANNYDCSGKYLFFGLERLLISWFNHCPGQTQCVKRLRKMSEITHFQLDHAAIFQWCSFLFIFEWNGMLLSVMFCLILLDFGQLVNL